MNMWQQQCIDVLRSLMGVPPSNELLIVLTCLAVLVFLGMFNGLTKLLKFPVRGLPYSLLTTVIVCILVIGGAWLALLHIAPLPFVKKWHLFIWIPYIGGLIPLFAIAAPLLRLFHHSRYGESISAIILAILCVACAVGITYTASLAAQRGDRDFNITRERTATMNRFLNE